MVNTTKLKNPPNQDLPQTCPEPLAIQVALKAAIAYEKLQPPNPRSENWIKRWETMLRERY